MAWNAFKDRVALITGSSRGIGNAIALRFAQSGADVIINYLTGGGRSQQQAELLCKEIQSIGRKALVIQADISVKQSVKQMFGEVREKMGRLDFLILNAAKAPFKPLEKLFERELRQLVETNYMGNIFCIQEALPLLEKHEGRVVFVSSLGSRFYNPEYPLGSMKAAMESVVRDLSESLREKKINVNAVCGGFVKTDSFKVLRQTMEDLEQLPNELFVEPEALADVVLFLCDPASRSIRGQTLVVDQGLGNTLVRPKPQRKP
jgi:NAD(P)-dependent dehydrogenase (short-subunit alcohol dehydrogenase family)